MFATFFRPNEQIAQQMQADRERAATRHTPQVEPAVTAPVQRRARRWHHGEVVSAPRLRAVR
ncbi:hypothetical protein [Luteipulveratus halotolerans]|uniref:Uncharacterized protein n=1 Tax=Luteipulveratus halotolerans TaxID=1631356 RepID=A0A0L6CFF4_9MICO|nr:hypothetical protein [Luteipulveratus halotolerans]KNX36335.1 hypothetical protein VV01_02985 [Luteipulveratus halotolerans]